MREDVPACPAGASRIDDDGAQAFRGAVHRRRKTRGPAAHDRL
jgi:hypothetical protein